MPLFAVWMETAAGVSDSEDLDRLVGLDDETLVSHPTLSLGEGGALSANCEVDAETPFAAAQQALLWIRGVTGLDERDFVALNVGPAQTSLSDELEAGLAKQPRGFTSGV